MATSKDAFATSFRLSDFIHAQKGVHQPLQDYKTPSAEGNKPSEEDKHINMLLCWAY
jgi:hypothetical protein